MRSQSCPLCSNFALSSNCSSIPSLAWIKCTQVGTSSVRLMFLISASVHKVLTRPCMSSLIFLALDLVSVPTGPWLTEPCQKPTTRHSFINSHYQKKMGSLRAILSNPDDLYPLLKLKMAARHAEKQIPPVPHWGFCYTMLHRVSRSFALVIQQLDTDLRDAVCIFYLVLRALDTVEDDTSIATEVKVPILMDFYRYIYDREWHFSCGTKDYKVLMDEFHHVSTAFLELGRSYQEAIEDITMRMGAGMAKFICKEVETVGDYDEYCHYVAGLVGLGLSKLFHASGKEDLASDAISNSMGLFLQKTNIIRDYLEDINEIPKSRMFWPRQIWSKYVNKLEDLKYEENSVKAVQCLNDMVTNALMHAEDCLKYMSALRDPAIFRFCAIPQIMAIGTLALCYNNVQVFRGVVKMRRGLTARVIHRTKTMSDVYGAFYDFSRMLKSRYDASIVDQVDGTDHKARETKDRLEAILRTCRDSGTLNERKSYIIRTKPKYNSTLIVIIFIILAILIAYLSSTRPYNMCKFLKKIKKLLNGNDFILSDTLFFLPAGLVSTF
ncbi:Squalene synthase [Abeliophyllum distichum]|uniref:Squalene synthase n=1 Tax=Abeliophyllum distichum TaxID=126358 RepID=A0ABD1RQH0_9LAMI